jgi:hypothetical protein
MKVARVTVTATIHGLIAGFVAGAGTAFEISLVWDMG